MSVKHLSDSEIQEYLDNNKSDDNITSHLISCDICSSLLSQYEMLYKSIEIEEIKLNPNFTLKTMELVHEIDSKVSYSYRNVILLGIAGVTISLLSMILIVGHEVLLSYFKIINLSEMFTYKESTGLLFGKYSSIIKITISGGIIVLFYTQLDRILSKMKTSKLSLFSI